MSLQTYITLQAHRVNSNSGAFGQAKLSQVQAERLAQLLNALVRGAYTCDDLDVEQAELREALLKLQQMMIDAGLVFA